MVELNEDDIRAWQQGRKSLSDLAALAGVSKQAIGARLKRRGIKRDITGAAGAGNAPAAPVDPVAHLMGRLQAAPDREAWLGEVANFCDGISLSVLGQLNALACGESATAGAQQLKLVTQALSGVLDTLERTGRIVTGDDTQIETMRITVMSLEEESEIRERAELEARGLLNPDDLDDDPGHTDDPQTVADDTGPTVPPSDAGQPSTAAADGSSDHPLAAPLRQLASERGTQRLRQIALSVGCSAPRDRDALIDALVEHADADHDAYAAIRAAVSRPSQG